MVLIKLLTILLIFQTTLATAVDVNGKNENHMCLKDTMIPLSDGLSYMEPREVCCDGYISISGDKCIPKCEECIHGFCAKPNVCECNKGYKMVQKQCLPTCKPECVNGYCVNPGQCVCRRGFKFEATNSTTCIPKCDPDCPEFSTCIEPNKCQCKKGYKENERTKQCEPHCPDMPKNAKCVKPFSWDCNDNFRHDSQIKKCILTSCSCTDKGYCLEHETECECYEGFKKNATTGQCEIFCEPPCVNSTCIANNLCQCSDGSHMTSKLRVCASCDGVNNCLSSNGECNFKIGFMKFLLVGIIILIKNEIF